MVILMKALILNGSEMEKEGATELFSLVLNELKKMNWDVTSINLKDIDLAYCTGCFGCWIKTPGECVIKDYSANISEQIIHSDLLIYFTPITFGGYSSILKKALDRQICLLLPFFQKVQGEIHHTKRYEKYPSLIAIGIMDKPDTEKEEVFETLLHRNAINMWNPFVKSITHTKNQEPSEFCNIFNETLIKVEGI